MQTSNSKISVIEPQSVLTQPEAQKHMVYCGTVLLFFIASLIFSMWLMQHSMNAYIQQTYHQDSPLIELEQYEIWRMGGDIGVLLNESKQDVDEHIQSLHQQIIDNMNSWLVVTKKQTFAIVQPIHETIKTLPDVKQKIDSLDPPQPDATVEALPVFYELSALDEVLFVGDSLMQGVAPHVQKQLNEQYQIKTINLSKQSTGLTYTKLFDWPATVKQAFKGSSRIKLMVVFLGPNDPWDMFDPIQKKWLTFGTEAWAMAYQQRMQTMIHEAKEQGAHILWLNPPNMGKADLNKKMQFLIQVIQQKVNEEHVGLIDTRHVLFESDTQYRPTIQTAQGLKKLRTADGIHFTPEGQKMIAHAILDHIKVVSHD